MTRALGLAREYPKSNPVKINNIQSYHGGTTYFSNCERSGCQSLRVLGHTQILFSTYVFIP